MTQIMRAVYHKRGNMLKFFTGISVPRPKLLKRERQEKMFDVDNLIRDMDLNGEQLWDQEWLPNILGRIFEWMNSSPFQRYADESSDEYDQRIAQTMGVTDEMVSQVELEIESLLAG